jgi:hypothetical protein
VVQTHEDLELDEISEQHSDARAVEGTYVMPPLADHRRFRERLPQELDKERRPLIRLKRSTMAATTNRA